MYRIREYGNQVRLIYKKIEGLSSVALGIWVNTGSRNEEPCINGISHFLEHLVFKGSGKFTGDQIKESIEGVGGSLNAFTSEEYTCYYAKFLAKYQKKIFSILSDMALYPLLKDEDIHKERTVIIEEIKMYKDLPQYHVQELFDALMWPDHSLGRNIAGSIASVSAISRDQIVDYHRCWYSPASIVIACAGDLDEAMLEDLMTRSFARLKSKEKGSFVFYDGRVYEEPRFKLVSKEIEQTHINLGFPGLDRCHKDRFVLGLIHVILGGNMSSRLFNEVREKKGLAYEIGTQTKKYKDTGAFLVRAGIDNRNLIEASKVILAELKKIKESEVSKDELKRAKEFCIGQSVMALDDAMDHMLWMGESLMSLGGIETPQEFSKQIVGVTSSDILRVAGEIINTERLCFAAIGPGCCETADELRGVVSSLR